MTDDELTSHALNLWANYIETGDVILSARDVSEQNTSRKPSDQLRIRARTDAQIELVRRIRALSVARAMPSVKNSPLPGPR